MRLIAKRPQHIDNPMGWAVGQILKGIVKRIKKARYQLMPWARRFFNEYLYNEPSTFHTWVCERLRSLSRIRGTKLCVIAPRGNAKSTWLTLIYATYCALEGIESYIIIISDSATQARLMLRSIKEEIEYNPAIKKRYANVAGRGPIWREDRIVLPNGVLIEAIGSRMKVRGRRKNKDRPSLIIIDDPQNDENVESAKQRNKAQLWLDKAVLNAGNKKTNIIMIGTAIHRESLVMNAKANAVWETHLFQSVISWPLNMGLWSKWEGIYCDLSNPKRERDALRFYKANKPAMDEGAKVLWKEEESLYHLMKLRLAIGPTSFEAEKQNNPRNPQSSEFPDEAFGSWIWVNHEDWPEPDEFNLRVITLDPSKGKADKPSDYSAIIKIGRCSKKILWVDADIERRPVQKIVRDVVAHARSFDPHGIGVESNAFQELLCEPLTSELRSQLLGHIPVYPMVNSVKKEVRIRRLGGRLASRELRFRKGSKGASLLVQQLQDFPTGDHDDGPDCLEMGCRLMVDIFNSNVGASYIGNSVPV